MGLSWDVIPVIKHCSSVISCEIIYTGLKHQLKWKTALLCARVCMWPLLSHVALGLAFIQKNLAAAMDKYKSISKGEGISMLFHSHGSSTAWTITSPKLSLDLSLELIASFTKWQELLFWLGIKQSVSGSLQSSIWAVMRARRAGTWCSCEGAVCVLWMSEQPLLWLIPHHPPLASLLLSTATSISPPSAAVGKQR